jgi:hypothetical protein
MSKLAEAWLQFDGKIYLSDPIKFEVLNKLPVGVIEAKIQIGIEYGNDKSQSQPIKIMYNMEDILATIYYKNIPLVESFPLYSIPSPNMTTEIKFTFRLSVEDLSYIESRRADDINDLIVKINGFYSSIDTMNRTPIGNGIQSFYIFLPWKFSQKEWIDFLNALGYAEKWIVEIDRPRVEGFYEVIEFLDKAKSGLSDNSSPDAIISDLRSAWDCLDPFLTKFQESISAEINSGSKGEKDQPSKSERLNEVAEASKAILSDIVRLKKAIDKLTQIGPHKESYVSTREDAILAYRLTVSMISYYSALLKEVSEQNEIRGQN